MKSYLVISGSGPDRVGLVDEISGFLTTRELNIEDSRMAVLGGEFALILLVSGEDKNIKNLVTELPNLMRQTGLTLQARETKAPASRQLEKTLPYQMVVSGMDHPGIVRRFTGILHKFQTNIEAMETRVKPAPLSGTPVFTMECKLAVPAQLKIKDLKSELLRVAEEENLDLEFEPAEPR